MRSGNWRIIVSGNQISVQRSITLTVGQPQTVWYTVRMHANPLLLPCYLLGAKPMGVKLQS